MQLIRCVLATLALVTWVAASLPAAARDLPDPTTLPGLTDAHYHLRGVGERELTLNLASARSVAALQAELRAWAEAHPDAEWLTGRGWIETHFDPPVFPSRQDIDAAVADRPVYLVRADGHAGLGNSRALALAGITRETEAPFGGDILKDAAGDPTGMLIDSAQDLVRRHIPNGGRPEVKEALRVGGEVAARQGWAVLHTIADSWDQVEALRALYREDRMPVRNYVAVRWPGEGAEHLLEHGPFIGEFDGRLTIRAIKINMDGALGVIASMQPSHAIGDLHFAPRRLGLERLRYAYAWRDLIDSGAVVIGGSDAPVEVGDPRIEFHAAITRTDLEGHSGEGWHTEQAVSWDEAVKMFTEWPAFAAFED